MSAPAEPVAEPLKPGKRYPPPPRPEPAWPALASVLGAIALQFLLPERLTVGPNWLLAAPETALLIGLTTATPMQLEHEHPLRRRLALTMTALVSLVNVGSLCLLIHYLFNHSVQHGKQLIVAGSLIWLTNVVIFALWYWETDRGGPGMRAAGRDGRPDFLFPQMTDDVIEPGLWRPQFIDYLYVSLTNAMAFSPTDTLPLTSAAKSMMGLQALVSIVTVGLVVARAVNIL
jgi:uncharacterized membrane protein